MKRLRNVDKSIISSPDIRRNLFQLLSLMEKTDMAVQYHHNGKVHILKSYETNVDYKQRRRSKHQVNPLTIQAASCEICGGVTLADVCLAQECPNATPGRSTTSGIL
jgi:hypothetical protein